MEVEELMLRFGTVEECDDYLDQAKRMFVDRKSVV